MKTLVLAWTCLLLGTLSIPASADWEMMDFTEVIPPNPASVDEVAITIGGWWGSSCIPRDSAISSVGSNIYFDVIAPPPSGCADVMTRWDLTETVGPLSPDTYTVYARVLGEPHTPETYTSVAEFIVTDYQFVVSTESLTVPEGETATVTVILMNPLGTVEVTVARVSGDPDITVESGASLIFDPCNYSVPQIVTLVAAEDDDYLDGETLIKVSASGYLPLEVLVSESDNDTPSVLYVDVDATGGNDGRSWADAFTNLHDAMSIAAAYSEIEEISVAQGVYMPAEPSGDRHTPFRLINGVTIKGGYAGYGEPIPNARNVQKYEAILSGDLNGDDGPNFTNRGDNSFHVVTGSGTNHTAILDGFTITAGDGAVGGGGMKCYNGDPTIRNCTFSRNRAYYGGGIRCYESKLTIINCIFTGNGSPGGSIDDGGGMYTRGVKIPTLVNCIFIDNWTTEDGGGLSCGSSQVKLTNCIFRGNSDGGGTDESAQIHGVNPAINYCCIQGWTGTLGGTGNIGNDPLFVNPNNGDYHLLPGSPCIDTGDNSVVDANYPDLDGNPRIINGIVDMGVYEFNPNTAPVADAGDNQIVYICADGAAQIELDGSSSTDADSDELEYLWTWEIEGTVFDANGVSPIIELPVGLHAINLSVDDGVEVSEPNSCVIEVIEGIEVDLRVMPRVINRKSRIKRILAVVQLPAGIDEDDIDGSFWLYPGEIEPRFRRLMTVNGSQKLFMVFDKSQLMAAVGANGPVVLEIEAQLISGRCLYGSDRIRIIRRGRGPREQTGLRKGTRSRRNRVQNFR